MCIQKSFLCGVIGDSLPFMHWILEILDPGGTKKKFLFVIICLQGCQAKFHFSLVFAVVVFVVSWHSGFV